MMIQVLGAGCPTCKKFYELTLRAVKELGSRDEVVYSSDIQKILDMGLISSPVLVIDGKVVIYGSVPTLPQIKKIIEQSREG